MKHSIRKRLMISFALMCTVTFVSVVLVLVCVSESLKSINGLYESNARLEEFSKLVTNTEKSVENYMNIKTFENISIYYSFSEKMRQSLFTFYPYPSSKEINQAEYEVVMFSKSLLSNSDITVVERRADNISVAADYYNSVRECYIFLQGKIDDLNNLYFEQNHIVFNQMKEIIHKLIISSIILISMVIGFCICFIYSSLKEVLHPLEDLRSGADRLAEKDFDIPLFVYENDDEIASITRAFNRMIISIREYIDTIWEKALYENEMREKEMKMNELYQEARFASLQQQINPHFLFNTLNTAAQLALLEGSDKTCDFLEQVADFYRYNLRHFGKECSLEDELKMVQSYIYIMKVRFGEKFNFFMNIQTKHLDLKIPGMVLQPLIENSIKHGLGSMTQGGRIELSARDDECTGETVISLSDNGIGFSDDALKDFNDKKSSLSSSLVLSEGDEGVGLLNVCSRLNMFYKRDDVLSIASSADGGAKIVIRIGNV